jgi:glycosyltransferase involved in cell wall biosynthesis
MNGKVLVTILAYNEEMTIREVVMAVRQLYPEFDIVVINDGSTDKTGSEAKIAGAWVITLPFNTGGRGALLTSYSIALRFKYDYLVKIDADRQHKACDISRILQPLLDNSSDMSVGSRYLSTEADQDSLVKTGGRVFSSVLLSRLSERLNVTDVTSGFRAWRNEALRKLMEIYTDRTRLADDSVFWLVETVIAGRLGLRLKEVPIEVLPRAYGKSKCFALSKMLGYPFRLMFTLIEIAW